MIVFESNGNLPPGIHKISWQELVEQYGYNTHRYKLLDGLKQALQNLKQAGCQIVYIDGSFVTNKELPEDFDGCWQWDNVDDNKLDPVLLTFSNGRAAQKQKYGGELFPNDLEGISALSFLEYFQLDKYTKQPKGIIQIELRELP